MLNLTWLRNLTLAAVVALTPFATGCVADTGSDTDAVTDVPHTPVERQSIGNCWLYAEASWVESLNLAATGVAFDLSQSYWTYWHWYEQIVEEGSDEISTGGGFSVAKGIILRRGLMQETKFVPEDATSEMSSRQSSALNKMNSELKSGRLATSEARGNRELVRKVMDEAWGLSPTVKGWMTKVFAKDYSRDLQYGGAVTTGTAVKAAKAFQVAYTTRTSATAPGTPKTTTLDVALSEWREAYYPSSGTDAQKRTFQIRIQKAAHDRQPVVLTWNVDFNAMESYDPVLRGSFNLTTLKNAGGPGRQGGHMTVLEDYEAVTEQYGELKAGVTLDPSNPDDAAKLEAALLPSTTIKFFRIKNSWGAFRDDRSSAPGFPGYHDLYMDYMNGPIAWCPDVEGTKTTANCTGSARPFRAVVLPPGY